MAWLAGFRKKVIEGWTVQRIAAVLIVAGLLVFVFGAVTQYCTCVGWPNLGDVLNHMIGDFYANVSVDCLSVAFAILVIDRLNERRAEQESKAQLIREMGSPDNGIALRAVGELRGRGWLMDGSLQGANLIGANLQNANMRQANLQRANLRDANLEDADLSSANLQDAVLLGASLHNSVLEKANLENVLLIGSNLQSTHFVKANLQRANLTHANLQEASLLESNLQKANLMYAKLQGAFFKDANLQAVKDLTNKQLIAAAGLLGTTMVDGSIYDGRLNLQHDFFFFTSISPDGIFDHIDNPAMMAYYYGVSLEEYLTGQEWARENLPRLRREAGLDPDTGRPVELQPTNGVEPLPADAPAQPTPRRNGHKASMVTHRVRR